MATNALTHDCSTKHEVDVSGDVKHSGEIECNLDGSKLDVSVDCACDCTTTPAVSTEEPCDTVEIVPVWSIGVGGGVDTYMAMGEYHVTPQWSVFVAPTYVKWDETHRVMDSYRWKMTNVTSSSDEWRVVGGVKWTKYKRPPGQPKP